MSQLLTEWARGHTLVNGKVVSGWCAGTATLFFCMAVVVVVGCLGRRAVPHRRLHLVYQAVEFAVKP
jgi:hypothetical protein